jgi:hypothetical protein
METKTLEMQQVMDRLERVEAQNRRLVRGGLALVLLCGSALLIAEKPFARDIEAERFTLKDAAGKVRAELAMTEAGGPELVLYSDGGIKALLNADNSGPNLVLWRGDAIAHLSADKHGPSLKLFGPKGTEGTGVGDATLGIDNDGPSFELFGPEGTGVGDANLNVGKDGPSFRLVGNGDKGSADLTVGGAGPHLFLKDLQGFSASLGSEALATPTTAASIYLTDPKGKNLWSAP